MPMIWGIIGPRHSGMSVMWGITEPRHSDVPVTGSNAPDCPAGLSPHARELWRASLRYRRLADALAANGSANATPDAAAPTAPTADRR
jgi:hypothetical protein